MMGKSSLNHQNAIPQEMPGVCNDKYRKKFAVYFLLFPNALFLVSCRSASDLSAE